jgi:hypothetical protein
MGYLESFSFTMSSPTAAGAEDHGFGNTGEAERSELFRDWNDPKRPINGRSAIQYCISNDLI